MNYNLEIQKILLKLETIKNVEDQIVLIKQAINIADANNDLDWSYDLRMDLVRTEQFTAHSHESFSAFAWILHTMDSHPDIFPEEEEVMAEYKWLAAVSYNNLRISREQVEAIFEDFRIRCERIGYSKREYYDILSNWSLFLGEKENARKYLDLRDLEEKNPITSSGGDSIISIYVEMYEGEIEKAITHISEFVAQKAQHHMTSIPVYSGLIYYLGGKTYDERVIKYFNEADAEFSELQIYPFQLYEVSLMMHYMSRHNKDKAWQYFERFVNWEIDAEASVRFEFALSILPLLNDDGTRVLEAISNKHPYYKPDNTYQLKELYNYYLDIVKDLANKFDERNGNSHFTDDMNELLAI